MKRVVGIILCSALMSPALAAPQQKSESSPFVASAASAHAAVCSLESERQRDGVNPEYVWRLRAYQHLDCVLPFWTKR